MWLYKASNRAAKHLISLSQAHASSESMAGVWLQAGKSESDAWLGRSDERRKLL